MIAASWCFSVFTARSSVSDIVRAVMTPATSVEISAARTLYPPMTCLSENWTLSRSNFFPSPISTVIA